MTTKTKEELLKELESLKERLNELENADFEQKKVIEALRESEAKYHILFDAAPVGIGIADLRGNIIDANINMQEMSGFSLEEYRAIGVGATYADPEERRLLLKTLKEKGKVRDWEGRLKRKDGSEYHTLLNADIMELGGRKVLLGIIRDISGSRRMEQTLRESEEKYRRLVETLMEGIWALDKDANTTFVNPRMAQMLGYTVDEMLGKHLFSFMDGRGRMNATRYLERRAQSVKEQHDFEFIRKDGTRIYTSLETSPITDESGNYSGAVAAIADITKRKRVEEELKQSEEKYRLLIENIQEGVFVIQDTKMQFANQAFAEITGYTIGEIIGMDFNHFVAPEDLEMVQDRYYRRQKGEDVPSEYEFHVLRRDGEKPLVKMTVGIVTYRGRVASMGILEDITERKRAEKLIKQSEERYRNLVELTTDIIYMTDKERKHVFMNDAGYRILEALPEEVIDHHWSECVYPDDREKSFKKFRKMLDKGIDVFEFENRYFSKSGIVINVLHNVRILRNELGEVIGTQGIARDITERKRIEESLKLFSEAVESAPDGIQIVDTGGHIKYSNKAVEEIYGFSNDELIGKNVGELNADPEIAEKIILQGIVEKGHWTGELIVRHKDGHKFPIWLTTSLVKDETGIPIAMVGIIRDITERKKVEKALLESETRYRTLFESASDAIFILEAQGEEGRIVAANRTAAKMHGYSIEELLTMNIDDLDTRESRNDARDFIKLILNGESVKAELDHCRKDGTVFPVEINAGLLELGGHKYILAFDRDITERKHVEETLRLSNLVVENSQTVLFRWKAQEGWPVEFVSNNVIQFGYSAQDFLSGALPYASIIYPDDLEGVSKEVREHSESGDCRFRQEYRIIAKNGAVHWIDDRTVIERNMDGQITNYQGIIIDITERKHTEEAIRKYNLELEESNRTKELFTDIMHHDLLNPINVANGYVELFLDDETNPLKRSYLETIKRNLVKGMELIDNATKFSKLESMENIEFEDMDLKQVVTEAIENLTPLASKAKIRIENRLKGKMPARANKIIEDVFANLISNAIKYAPQGKKIVIDGKDVNSSWMIWVMDFGSGIKDADKKLVFERFRRGDKLGIKGSGLGLAIARKIVELHKGRIRVEDNPECGAVFVVEIPKSES